MAHASSFFLMFLISSFTLCGAATQTGRSGPILRRSGFEGKPAALPRGLRRRAAQRRGYTQHLPT